MKKAINRMATRPRMRAVFMCTSRPFPSRSGPAGRLRGLTRNHDPFEAGALEGGESGLRIVAGIEGSHLDSGQSVVGLEVNAEAGGAQTFGVPLGAVGLSEGSDLNGPGTRSDGGRHRRGLDTRRDDDQPDGADSGSDQVEPARGLPGQV